MADQTIRLITVYSVAHFRLSTISTFFNFLPDNNIASRYATATNRKLLSFVRSVPPTMISPSSNTSQC